MTDSRWGRARRNSLHDRICLARNDPATILDREEQVNFATTYLICAVLGQNDEVNVELGELAESSHSSQESTHVGPFVQQLMEIEKQYGEHEFALHEETVENVRMVVDTVWRHVVPRSAAPGQLTEPGTSRPSGSSALTSVATDRPGNSASAAAPSTFWRSGSWDPPSSLPQDTSTTGLAYMESNLRSFASRMDSRTTQMEAHAYIRRVYRQLLSIEYAGEDEDDEEMDESGHVSDADMTVE